MDLYVSTNARSNAQGCAGPREVKPTYTMELKLANGVSVCCGRRGGEPILNARPGPRPAPPAPPPALRRLSIAGVLPGVGGPTSLPRVSPAGLVRFADADMPGGARRGFAPPRFSPPMAAVVELSPFGALPIREVPGGMLVGGGR